MTNLTERIENISLALFVASLIICFTGLFLISVGWSIGTDFFPLGFDIVIFGLILGVIVCVILALNEIYRKT